jgi:hypothetical protein
MIDSPGPVIFDCRVEKSENCFPMIPSGKAHNEMILPSDDADLSTVIDAKGWAGRASSPPLSRGRAFEEACAKPKNRSSSAPRRERRELMS